MRLRPRMSRLLHRDREGRFYIARPASQRKARDEDRAAMILYPSRKRLVVLEPLDPKDRR